MSAGGAAIRGWMRLLPWLLLLGGLAASGWWRYYLAPRHMPYLCAGLAVLVLVALLGEVDGWLSRRQRLRFALATRSALPAPPRPANLSEWLETGVHWLPLLLLLVLGPTTLSLRGGAPSSQQLSRLRGRAATAVKAAPLAAAAAVALESESASIPAGEATAAQAKPEQDSVESQRLQRLKAETEAAQADLEQLQRQLAKEAARGQALLPPAAPVRDPSQTEPPPQPAYREATLVDLFLSPGAASGEIVEVIGRLHRVHGDDPVVPLGVDPSGVEVVLYRYAVWCCVADAVPATAILEGIGLDRYGDEQWVRLRGTFHQTGATQDIPLLKVDSVEPIPEPKDPYLYSGPEDL